MSDEKISTRIAKAAILAGLTKTVPVPFLDSFLLRKVKEGMVSGIAMKFDVNQDVNSLRPLYAPPRGCLMNILIFILAIPFLPFIFIYKVMRIIIRMIFFFLKIHDVAMIMGNTLMLGHTVKRCLNDGRIPHSTTNDKEASKATYKASAQVRKVFEKTYKGSDFRLVGKLLTDLTITILKSHKILLLGIKSIFGAKSNAAPEPAPPPLPQSDSPTHSRAEHPCPPLPLPPPLDPLPESNESGIGYFATQLSTLLNHHDMKRFIREFDSRFDKIMLSHTKTS